MKRLRTSAPSRGVTDVGRGDYVKIGSTWKEIAGNSAAGATPLPRSWTVRTTDGGEYSMYDVNRYAKAEDLK